MKKIYLIIFILLCFTAVKNVIPQEQDASKVFDNCIEKVGLITDDKNGFGSGFFINPNTFITNNHVVEGLDKSNIFIRLKDGSEIDAELIATDKKRDLAILVTDYDKNDYLYLLLPDDVRQGDKVFALGNPSTQDAKVFEFNITDGIVNNIKYDTFKGDKLDIDAEVLLHSATINPGNSGGPLVTSNGSVAGVNSFYYNAGNNLYFAIHVGELIDFLKENDIKYKTKTRDDGMGMSRTMQIILWSSGGFILLIAVISVIIAVSSNKKKKMKSQYQPQRQQQYSPPVIPTLQRQPAGSIPLSNLEKTVQFGSTAGTSPQAAPTTALIYKGKRYSVSTSNFIVGRGINSNLVLEDELASRQHFVIIREGAEFRLKDLNSKNGTFLNGKKVTEAVLKNSDVIKAGNSSIIFNK
jgi:hypothetical protein